MSRNAHKMALQPSIRLPAGQKRVGRSGGPSQPESAGSGRSVGGADSEMKKSCDKAQKSLKKTFSDRQNWVCHFVDIKMFPTKYFQSLQSSEPNLKSLNPSTES